MSDDDLELEIELLDIHNNGWTAGQGPWWHERIEVVEHPEAVELRVTAVNVRGERPTVERGNATVRLARPLSGRPVLDLFSTTLLRPERAPAPGEDPGGLLVTVPFRKAERAGAHSIVVWWTSQPGHLLVDVDVQVEDDRAIVTLREWQNWAESIAEQRVTVVHAAHVGRDAEIVDGTSGRVPEAPVLDVPAAWARFDDSVAEVALGLADERDLVYGAALALEHGCEGAALVALRDRRGSVAEVLRERGLEPPDARTAAKRLVDKALERTRDDDKADWETIGRTLIWIVEDGRLDADHVAQLAPLVRLFHTWERRFEQTGDGAEPEADRFDAACQALLEAGGLRP